MRIELGTDTDKNLYEKWIDSHADSAITLGATSMVVGFITTLVGVHYQSLEMIIAGNCLFFLPGIAATPFVIGLKISEYLKKPTHTVSKEAILD